MVISEPGLICLETSEYRLLRDFASLWFGPPAAMPDRAYAGSVRPPVRIEPSPASSVIQTSVAEPSPSDAMPIQSDVDEEGSVSELTDADGDEVEPLTAQERRARSAALRGMLHSRQRRFGAAQAAFTEAARIDPALSLESIPTFWDLERGAHEAAVRAYEAAGRTYDASMLASRLRTTYRPRLLSPRDGAPSPAS